jgi:inward rectifier potassium channel
MSTVGGVGITPTGMKNSFILTVESMTALLCVAVITGLLFVRLSKSTAKIVFSDKGLIGPYKDGKGLMIRIANGRKVEVVELRAHLFFLTYDPIQNKRNFKELKLEQSSLPFSSTTWTVVHPIIEGSPFFAMDDTQKESLRFNVIIYVGAIDSVSGQNIFSRQAYSKNDIIWNAKFLSCSELSDDGEILVYLDKISDYEVVDLLSSIAS